MVNYHDPVVVAQDYCASTFAAKHASSLSRLTSFDSGNIEALACLGWTLLLGVFHYSQLRAGCLPRASPLPLDDMGHLLTTRIATLLAVVLSLVDIDVSTRYNCKVETVFLIAFSFLAAAAASLLIVLRIIAIWNMKKIVIAIATSVWGAGFISQIQTIVRIRVESIPGTATCVVANPHIANLNTLVSFTTDIILLFIMLFGLFRLRFHKSSAFGMGRTLWRQGLVWLSVAFIADVLPLVFIYLNLNGPLDDIFLVPWIVASSIAATRIHRDLADYASTGCTEQQFDASHSHGKANGRAEWNAIRAPITRTQLSRMDSEVAIPEMYELDETPQMRQHVSAGPLIDVEGQLCEKLAGQPELDENVENDIGQGLLIGGANQRVIGTLSGHIHLRRKVTAAELWSRIQVHVSISL
ncbi:hypothetical protein BGY98DRAFT_1100954 [Russula aff. rugulosa BPL654]|nr:hypothetical protein BGY98DRAFT_1100954 [Russula aff. rugulosa BPL654]